MLNQRAWLMCPLTMYSFGVLVSHMTIHYFLSWKHDCVYNNSYFCYKTKPKVAEQFSFHCAELCKMLPMIEKVHTFSVYRCKGIVLMGGKASD